MWQESVCSVLNTDNKKPPIGEVFLFGKSVEIPPLSDIIIFSSSRKEVDSHEKESYPYRTHSFGFAECFLVGISL